MLNLLNTEFYKLFHSRYFWGIVAFNLFLSLFSFFWQSSFLRCLLEMTLDKERCNHISLQAITEDRYYLQN